MGLTLNWHNGTIFYNNLIPQITTKSNGDIYTPAPYIYDPNGNQLTRFANTLRAQNDPLSVIIFAIAGNNAATRRPIAEVTEYNAWNQIVSVVNTNYTVEYTYLPNGMRHSKTVSGRNISGRQTTTHVWDGMHIAAELNNSGNVVNTFTRGVGLIRSHHHVWYLACGNGSIAQRVDDSGEILHTYRFDGFGLELAPCDENNNPFRYAGEYYDFETGRIYLRARSYDPHTGRFTQEDPHWGIHNMIFGDEPTRLNVRQDANGNESYTLVPDAWSIIQAGNLYAYCMNNPILWIDPTGLFAETDYDVMLRFIAEKNGGTVTYTTSRWSFGRRVNSVTVEIDGVSVTYRSSDFEIINGRVVISAQRLMDDFGLTLEQATHQAGDQFTREIDAVMAFALMFHQRSLDERQEYAASINRNFNMTYSFMNVVNSTMTAAWLGYTIDPNSPNNDPLRNMVAVIVDINSVAHVHTHWRPDGNLNFSMPYDYLDVSEFPQLRRLYLVNRLGEVFRSERSQARNNINGWSFGRRLFRI